MVVGSKTNSTYANVECRSVMIRLDAFMQAELGRKATTYN
jgi:hypothetical protein